MSRIDQLREDVEEVKGIMGGKISQMTENLDDLNERTEKITSQANEFKRVVEKRKSTTRQKYMKWWKSCYCINKGATKA